MDRQQCRQNRPEAQPRAAPAPPQRSRDLRALPAPCRADVSRRRIADEQRALSTSPPPASVGREESRRYHADGELTEQRRDGYLESISCPRCLLAANARLLDPQRSGVDRTDRDRSLGNAVSAVGSRTPWRDAKSEGDQTGIDGLHQFLPLLPRLLELRMVNRRYRSLSGAARRTRLGVRRLATLRDDAEERWRHPPHRPHGLLRPRRPPLLGELEPTDHHGPRAGSRSANPRVRRNTEV